MVGAITLLKRRLNHTKLLEGGVVFVPLPQFCEGCFDSGGGFNDVGVGGGVTQADMARAREGIAAHGCHMGFLQ